MYGEMVLKEREGAITGLLLIFLENQIPTIYVIFFQSPILVKPFSSRRSLLLSLTAKVAVCIAEGEKLRDNHGFPFCLTVFVRRRKVI